MTHWTDNLPVYLPDVVERALPREPLQLGKQCSPTDRQGRWATLSKDARKQRDRAILELRQKGWGLQAIGDRFGITAERVRQVLWEASR